MVGGQGADSVGSSERLYCRSSSEGRWRQGLLAWALEEPAWQGAAVAADEELSDFIGLAGWLAAEVHMMQ